MITESGIKQLKSYCREPIENIRGYREAVESDGIFDCHHINELTFTKDELKKMNMYYNRPASELVIMTHSDHSRWHHKWNGNPMYGMTEELSPSWKGDKVGQKGLYIRARKLYNSGKMTEEEFQPFRDLQAEYQRSRRKGHT